jgi:methylenetetrahydrofolate reductase (NADPH)
LKTFRQVLQGSGFTFTAELSLHRETTIDEALQQAAVVTGCVDAIQLAENPSGRAQVSPLALSGLLARNGIDAVPRLICRDRNRIALQSELLGLRALGVSSLILDKGSRLPAGQEPNTKPVFDLSCRELVAMANAMNEEEWDDGEHEFVIGTSATVFAPEPGWNAELLLARAGAGARFLVTQPCFDPKMLRLYMRRMVEAKVTWNYSVIVTLAPLPSAESARWLVENHRGAVIPDSVIERLEKVPDPQLEGIDICAELMRDIAGIPGVSGFNLLTLGSPEAVVAALEASGLPDRK